ncbi:MAG: PA2779 family protein [Nitrospiraceae bacterium]
MQQRQPLFLWSRAMSRSIIVTMTLTTLLIGSFPVNSRAMLAPAEPAAPAAEAGATRSHDLETVQKVLEAKMVQQRLEDLGLSPEAASDRLHRLSDAQLHQLAMQIESLIPGGIDHVLGTILTVLLIILVAIIIIILV